MPTTFELQGITKRFGGTTALDGVSVAFKQGEVHAVIGENGAGKSTLINILAGEIQPDAGTILVDGAPNLLTDPHASQQRGISVVHQELALCPNLSVAENIGMRAIAGRFALKSLDRRAAARTARMVLAQLGAGHIRLGTPVNRLSVAEQQLIEIAKAITLDARLLILDEPNSALTYEESKHLFQVVKDLRAKGVSVLYVSHRLEEVLELADTITVMRDGQVVTTIPAAGATVEQLIGLMVGREIGSLYRRRGDGNVLNEPALSVEDLSDPGTLRSVAFTVNRGEVLGIAGLPGCGKDELVDCLFGLRPHTGALRVNGKLVKITSPKQAIANGLALIPADRRGSGGLMVMDIRQNVIAACLGRVSRAGLLVKSAISGLARDYMRKLDVRASGPGQRMGTLSGGNQQKVILARGLATEPGVLLLHEPTRGIDVGAKAEIYAILQGIAREGRAAIVVSSEMPELIGQCDRILAMHEGRVTGEFTQAEASEEQILACATGQATHLPARGASA